MKNLSRVSSVGLFATPLVILALLAARHDGQMIAKHGRSDLKAELWVQTSAEYIACCLQTYRCAGDEVERRARAIYSNPWAIQELHDRPLAVVMDLDETVLDNSAYQTYLLDNDTRHSNDLFSKFVSENRASIGLVPGAKAFINRMKQLGVKVVYISNRETSIRDATVATLGQWGIDTQELQHANSQFLLMDDAKADKSARREMVKERYKVVALLGDQLSDFTEILADTPAERLSARNDTTEALGEWWGKCWFILPNPVYGDWLGVIDQEPGSYLRRAHEPSLSLTQ